MTPNGFDYFRGGPKRRNPQRPLHDDAHPAVDALALLRGLGAADVPLDHVRFTLAVAFLMTVPSLEHAQRLLAVVDDAHLRRGIDLHAAVRPRAT